ncbi:MAG: ergothioneine biosynthesis protein EgtB [Acidimicrobiales bacterium]
MTSPSELADALTDVRARSLGLLEPVADEVLVRQHSPLMSPLVWDLGHIANYEEQWLVRAITGAPALRPELDDIYDAFRHPRRDRHALAVPGPTETRAYSTDIRSRALDVLDRLDTARSLLADGFVHHMVIQHEHQHDETMLAALQLLPAPGYRPILPSGAHASSVELVTEARHPGGTFTMGTSVDATALDNERPAHSVELQPFWMDTTPVTNRRYAEFVADGGYGERSWWSGAGWAWRTEAGLTCPQAWVGDGAGGWVVDRFGWLEALPLDEPVQHVCWYEADAFARWAGRRLPTEAEWEFAASNGGTSRWPWGSADPTDAHAALWTLPSPFGPGNVAAHPFGANRWGVHDLVGGVWEWTSSDFGGYPGFVAWPYREYSEVFFGDEYKVLRGGSWATDQRAMRATFRNWDYPIRRQIFAGFRCVRDA